MVFTVNLLGKRQEYDLIGCPNKKMKSKHSRDSENYKPN